MFLLASSPDSCHHADGGGCGLAEGAGRMGTEKTYLPALCELGAPVARSSVGTGWPCPRTEFEVATGDPSPGCTAGPLGRPGPPGPPRVGHRGGTLTDWSQCGTKLPRRGLLPEVGVCSAWVRYVGESLDRKSSWVAGESWGARWDFRLSLSIRPHAQSLRSTGVLFAAWTNGSRS